MISCIVYLSGFIFEITGAHCHNFAIDFWEEMTRMTKNGDKFFRHFRRFCHNDENGEKIVGKNGKMAKNNGEKAKNFRHYVKNVCHFRHIGENGEKIDSKMANFFSQFSPFRLGENRKKLINGD